jgi:hypothetical protein
MKEEEQRKKSLPEVVRRRWNGADLQLRIQSPPGIPGRGAAEAARKVKMLNVGKQRRRRRSFFSVPRSGGEAQGTKERSKKKTLWG